MALAYMFLTKGLAGVPAFEGSLLLLVEPVLNPIWTWMVHGEEPGSWPIVGGALVLCATAVKTAADVRGSGGKKEPPPNTGEHR